MLKRELKVNFKSLLIWTCIINAFFLVVYLVYPSLVTSSTIADIDHLLEIFPQDVLKAFNMDISSISTAFGWFKTEGFIFILLVIGIYSGMLGSQIVLKEESDKTIEYLANLPVTRTEIVLSKVICSLIYIVSMVLFVGGFNYIALKMSGELNDKAYLLLSITPLFSSLVIFGICLVISTFFKKTKYVLSLSIAIPFLSYLISILSDMGEKVEVFKYFTPFTLANIRNVILNEKIEVIHIIISLVITIICIVVSIYRYNKKEFL